jgi:hypothetical protein
MKFDAALTVFGFAGLSSLSCFWFKLALFDVTSDQVLRVNFNKEIPVHTLRLYYNSPFISPRNKNGHFVSCTEAMFLV